MCVTRIFSIYYIECSESRFKYTIEIFENTEKVRSWSGFMPILAWQYEEQYDSIWAKNYFYKINIK